MVIEDKDVLKKNDYPKEMKKVLKKLVKNENITMQDFIKNMLVKKGCWYKKKNFFKRKPGEEWFYSNVGASVAAYIVELVSKTPYDEFVKSRILKPSNLKEFIVKAVLCFPKSSALSLEKISHSFVKSKALDANL